MGGAAHGRGTFQSLGGPASRPPEVLEMARPALQLAAHTSTAGAGAVELQRLAHLSCDLTGRRLVEKAARVACGPDCRPSQSALLPTAARAQQASSLLAHLPTHTRRIGWHDAHQLRRLDARGDRARPDGGLVHCYRTSHHTPPSFDGCHWVAIQYPVHPSVARILPMQVGEKEVRFPEYPAPNITLGCRSHFTLVVPVPVFTFSTLRYPLSHVDVIRKKYLSIHFLASNRQGLTRDLSTSIAIY